LQKNRQETQSIGLKPKDFQPNTMNQQQIKQLETELWASADNLRANSKLTAAEYKDPVLGLILLRYAQNRYEQAKIAIEAAMPETPRGKLKPTKEHYLAAGAMRVPE
jgi:type I restriction enzyme M protein